MPDNFTLSASTIDQSGQVTEIREVKIGSGTGNLEDRPKRAGSAEAENPGFQIENLKPHKKRQAHKSLKT